MCIFDLKKLCLILVGIFGVHAAKVDGCEETCRFSYDNSFTEYRQRCDQAASGNIAVSDRAHFNGESFLSMSMFQQNSLRPSFSIAFIFKFTGSFKYKDVAILSNGCDEQEPTIEFRLRRQTRRRSQYATTSLNLRMTNDDRDMNITASNIDVNVYDEVLVQIAQNETALEVQVGGQPKHTFPKDINDYIIPSECPLQIGAGKGLDNFVGEFDEFVYFPCVNPGFFSIAELF